MTFIYLIGLGVVIGLIFLANFILNKKEVGEKEKKTRIKKEYVEDNKQYYEAKSKFFTTSEYMFFEELERQNNSKYHIFSKVRLEDIVKVLSSLDKKTQRIKRNSIKSRHIDFVLIDKGSGKVVHAIEVDGKSHGTERQHKSDEIKNKILKQSGVVLHRVRVGTSFKDGIAQILS